MVLNFILTIFFHLSMICFSFAPYAHHFLLNLRNICNETLHFTSKSVKICLRKTIGGQCDDSFADLTGKAHIVRYGDDASGIMVKQPAHDGAGEQRDFV